ncbi:MAG: hypothetical protein U0638_09280 [Phycisphaerales bacterium]
MYAIAEWDPDGPGGQPLRYAIGGDFEVRNSTGGRNIAVWDPAARTWKSLGAGVNDAVRAIAAMPDGSLVLAGAFTAAGDAPANRIARWNGTGWEALGDGVDNTVYALQALPNGDLAVGGSFLNAGGVSARRIARWDGSAWHAYANGFTNAGAVYALAVHNGELLAGGDFNVNATRLARWDGTAWQNFAGGTGFAVYHLSHAANGDLIVAGKQSPGIPVANIVRHNGVSWLPIGGQSQTDNTVRSVAELPNGDFVAAGDFTNIDGVPIGKLARWDGSSWSQFAGEITSDTVFFVKPLADSRLAVGGANPLREGRYWSGMYIWDGSAWSSPDLEPGFNGAIDVATRLHNGDIVVGGVFTRTPSGPANHVARWDGTHWNPLGQGVAGTSFPNVDALVETAGGDLIVGGMFDTAGGAPANNIARWDGASWHTMGSGIQRYSPGDLIVNDVAVMPNGDVIATGAFDTAGGVPANHIARWDGSAWWPLGSGMGGSTGFVFINSLIVMPTGDLVVGGYFTTAGGLPIKYIARWDGTNWWPLGQGVDNQVSAFALMPSGDLIAGGFFTKADGKTANRIAQWDGNSWSSLGAGVTATSRPWVLALDTLPNGELVAGGLFDTAGGTPAKNIAIWDGAIWQKMGDGIDASVYALAHRTSTDLFVGGEFLQAGGHDSAYFSRRACLCPADLNADGFVNGDDYDAFASLFDIADPGADLNDDGFVNGDDYDFFASHFDVGC